MRLWLLTCSILVALGVAVVGCGGGGDEGAADGNGDSGGALTEAEATALLDSVLLKPADLTAQWVIDSDEVTDNAAAASAPGGDAELIERCGRLTGRTITIRPQDPVMAFIGGETLSFFSTATVYATAAGAQECGAETALQLQEPGAFARTFGSVFLDPDAVQVALVDYPTVGDASFAATLTGDAEAEGTTLSLTILVVGFSKGNVTGAVGSARSGATPPVDELSPLVDLVVERIASAE
jgi:hypothetical protein